MSREKGLNARDIVEVKTAKVIGDWDLYEGKLRITSRL